jgi:glycosyltransferase involved in cell wall biosynthesis
MSIEDKAQAEAGEQLVLPRDIVLFTIFDSTLGRRRSRRFPIERHQGAGQPYANMLLSVVIPVYNERRTLGPILAAVARSLPNVSKEIVVVDDCSNDGTREWLKANFPDGPRRGSAVEIDGQGDLAFTPDCGASAVTVWPIFHERNCGKGGALQTGFAAIRGDVLVIQDADLEYDPNDWEQMYDLIATRRVADVVFGSRFYGRPHRSLYFRHYLATD